MNKTRFAVLGLLSIRPMSGYDLKHTIEASTRNFWNESYGQIYPALRALADAGLVMRQPEPKSAKKAKQN